MFKRTSIAAGLLLLAGLASAEITAIQTPPAGVNGNVQFNKRNSFGSDPTFTYSTTTKNLSVSTITVGSRIVWPDGTVQVSSPPAGGGSGTPGGSDTQVQFNDAGSFGGDSGMTYNKTTDRLAVSSASITHLEFSTAAAVRQIRWSDGTVQVSSPPSSSGGDNLGNHLATMTLTIPAPYGLSSSTGVFSSSLTVSGLTTGTTFSYTSGTVNGQLTVYNQNNSTAAVIISSITGTTELAILPLTISNVGGQGLNAKSGIDFLIPDSFTGISRWGRMHYALSNQTPGNEFSILSFYVVDEGSLKNIFNLQGSSTAGPPILNFLLPGQILQLLSDTSLSPKIYGSGSSLVLTPDASGGVTQELVVGQGTAGIDYSFRIDGQDNDGSFRWMEDENWFEFQDAVRFSSSTVNFVSTMTLSGGTTVCLQTPTNGAPLEYSSALGCWAPGTDDSGSGADNLGSHVATKTVTMDFGFTASTGTVSTFTVNTLLTIPNSSVSNADAFGEVHIDTDAWATNRGAMQLYDGTVKTFVVATVSTDTPTNGEVPRWNTGGQIDWATVSTSSPASNPCVKYYDLEATDGDINGQICLQCTDTGSGTEDCDIYLDQQINGVLTRTMLWDADDIVTSSRTFAAPRLRLPDSDGSNYVEFRSTPAMTTNIDFMFPSSTAAAIVGGNMEIASISGTTVVLEFGTDGGGAGGSDNLGNHIATQTISALFGIDSTTTSVYSKTYTSLGSSGGSASLHASGFTNTGIQVATPTFRAVSVLIDGVNYFSVDAADVGIGAANLTQLEPPSGVYYTVTDNSPTTKLTVDRIQRLGDSETGDLRVNAGVYDDTSRDPYYVIGNSTDTSLDYLYSDIFKMNVATYSASYGYVGLGVSSPTARLHLNGTIKFEGGQYKGFDTYSAGAGLCQNTNGCTSITQYQTSTSSMNYVAAIFPDGSTTYWDITVPLPFNYDASTFTYFITWTSTVAAGDVQWNVQARAVRDGVAIDGAPGTVVTVTDTATGNETFQKTAESAAMTASGSPVGGDFLQLIVYRGGQAAADTMTADARFTRIQITYTKDNITPRD